MRRREFLSRSLAFSAMAGLTRGKALSSPAGGWNQLPGILARIVPPQFPDRDFDVTDYGAVGDGQTDCRPAIAAAIQACNLAGGGRVMVPPGNYLVNGPIHLLSNVNLYLAPASYLVFGTDPMDYLPAVEVRWQGIRCYNYSPFIYAYQQTNIALTGSGVIFGQGGTGWYQWSTRVDEDWTVLQDMAIQSMPVEQRLFGSGHYLRPTMFEPYQCSNILLEGVTFVASPFWTIHPTFCTNVTVQNVYVMPGVLNDDGCDPDSCQDVLIKGCSFNTSDDNVSLKAGFGPDAVGLPPCANVVIMDCYAMGTDWSAFTIGSNTAGGIENVFIENCVANDCIAAFYIKSNSDTGGAVEGVWIKSSQAINCHHLLFLQTDYEGVTGGPTPPLFTNINMQGVTCAEASVSAFWLEGDPRLPIQGVALADIAIAKTSKLAEIGNVINLAATNITVAGKIVKITA
jgi:polygalacturonase